ncbi:MAG: hypothetical protein PVS3B1_36270 [Ktedonobacteraceae bacterium]
MRFRKKSGVRNCISIAYHVDSGKKSDYIMVVYNRLRESQAEKESAILSASF